MLGASSDFGGRVPTSRLPSSHLLMMEGFLREQIQILHHYVQGRFDHLQHLSSSIQVINIIGATCAEKERGTAIFYSGLPNETIVPPLRDQLVASCPILRLVTQWPVEKPAHRSRKHSWDLRGLPYLSQQICFLRMEQFMFSPSEASGQTEARRETSTNNIRNPRGSLL